MAGLLQQLSLACQPQLQGVTRRQAIQISFKQALKLAAQYANEARNLFGRQRLSLLTITNLNNTGNGRHSPTAAATANGISGPIRLNWRLAAVAGRTNAVTASAERYIAGAKGLLAGWHYDAALNYS